MSDLPLSFLEYVNRRGYNTFDRPEEVLRRRKPWSYKQYRESIENELLHGEEETIFSSVDNSIGQSAVTSELLSTEGAAATASTGTATAISGAATASTTPIIALGAGIIGAATAAGIYKKVSESGVQVPTTKYIGPGNPIDSGHPTSFADADAQQHDIEYSKSNTDIQASDNRAIQKFGDHIAENNLDPSSIIGYSGLQVKKNIEKVTGQLYPSKYA